MEKNDAQHHVFRSPFLNSIATFHTLSLFHNPMNAYPYFQFLINSVLTM